MDIGVTNASPLSVATCLDPMIGSRTVFVNDGGVCKVGESMTITAGLIIGPGSQYVFCEDLPVSVEGDTIAAHPPCPIPPTHCNAFTGGSPNVFTGGVFPPAGSGSGPQFAQLSVVSFAVSVPPGGSIATLGLGWPGPITFEYRINNSGSVPTGPFTIALYEILGLPTTPPPPPPLPLGITITRNTSDILSNIVFIEEKRISGSIPPAGNITDSWTLPIGDPFAILPPNYVRYYVLAVDIDLEVFEVAEGDNASPITTVVTVS